MTTASTNPIFRTITPYFPAFASHDIDLRRNFLELNSNAQSGFFHRFISHLQGQNTRAILQRNVEEITLSYAHSDLQTHHTVSDLYLLFAQMRSLIGILPTADVMAEVSSSNPGIDMIIPEQPVDNVAVVFFQGRNSGYLFALTGDRISNQPSFRLHIFEHDENLSYNFLTAELTDEFISERAKHIQNRFASIKV